MAQSNSFNLTTNRDGIIARSLRIVGAIGQGETPSASAVTEAAEALNDLVKEWEADGMPLWAIRQFSFSMTSGVSAYSIGIGQTIDQNAPLKIFQCWNRTVSGSLDSPVLVITRQEYNMFGSKTTSGTPSNMWYNPPGGIGGTESVGTITLYPTPDSSAASDKIVVCTGQFPFMDFDSATDVPDFPPYWFNAIKWGLADQLAYEYGIGVTQRAQISKKAEMHKEAALSFGTEEGSLKIYPMPSWNWESY